VYHRPVRRLLPLLLILASCAPAADVPTVKLWHAYRGDERAALDAVVERLRQSEPGFEVEVLAVPSKAYKSRLMSALPRGNGPDLFIEAHELVGEWSNSKLLQPALFPEQTPPSAFAAPALDALRFGEQTWGVPLAVKSVALFHNKALAPTAPTTMEALIEAGRGVGKVPLAYEVGEFYHHAGLLHAFGGRPLDEAGRPELTSPGVQDSLAYAATLAKNGTVPGESDGALVATLFNQGEVPFVFNGPWFLGEIKDGVEYGVAPLPTVDGKPMRPFLTVEALFRAAHSTADDAHVRAVVQALAGQAGSVTRATQGRQALAHLGAQQDPAVAADTVLAAFSAQASAAVPMPNRPEMGAIWEPANAALRNVLRGARTPAEATAEAQRMAESFLKPPPDPANPAPYLVLLGFLTLAGAASLVQRTRGTNLFDRMREGKAGYAYVAPAFVGMTFVVFLPFLVGSAVSLFAHKDAEFTFVGLKNFWSILTSEGYGFTDPKSFWFTLIVTVGWTLANVALHAGLGLGLALLLRDPWMKLKGVYRVLLIVPWAVPNYITALIWRGMFNEQFGAINALLGLVGVEPVAWFSGFATSFAANLTTNTWLGFPFMMVVTLGALQAIPRDLEEAAEVDGAGAWLRFRHVTLPLLKPALLPAIILGSVWTFNMFNIIYLVSTGEPNGSTEILISEAYKWAFERQSQYGYASAYAVLVFGILWIYTRLTARVTGGGGALG
jgi:arabinogalactan oligomer/maltooligosaccharide transport system permease protein